MFRLGKINKIEGHFTKEIKAREAISKRLKKHFGSFDYIDKILIVLSARSGGISAISFSSIVGTPVWIASVSFSLLFSLTTGIIRKLLQTTRNKKKKYNKIVMLPKKKLSNIENLISQVLIDSEISHNELKTVVDEKKVRKIKRKYWNDKKSKTWC